jgi:hypothetical protein
MADLKLCESTFAPTLGDEDERDRWYPVYACEWLAGHPGSHMQETAGGHQPRVWEDEWAVKNRCPSLSPDAHQRTRNEAPAPLRCAREVGHAGPHTMVVKRAYGRAEQIVWPD